MFRSLWFTVLRRGCRPRSHFTFIGSLETTYSAMAPWPRRHRFDLVNLQYVAYIKLISYLCYCNICKCMYPYSYFACAISKHSKFHCSKTALAFRSKKTVSFVYRKNLSPYHRRFKLHFNTERRGNVKEILVFKKYTIFM